LAATPPLATDEWELLDDITVPPASEPSQDGVGNLWVGRGRRLLKITAAGDEVAKGELPSSSEMTTDFDPLHRPWIMSWHGAVAAPVTVAHEGALREYRDLAAALQGEAPMFAPGRIFPFAIKTPQAHLAAGGPFFDEFTVIDPRGPHRFTARQIARVPEPQHRGHGYNPFRGGEPWMDAAGKIYTQVDGASYVFNSARRSWSRVPEGKEPPSPLTPVPPVDPAFAAPLRKEIKVPDRGRIAFRGFHFYAVTEAGEQQQLDTGLNPLAFYPFWNSWYESPGMTQPRIDPKGHLWISDLGPYAENRKWLVMKRVAW
jgi:hypothetical protein